VKFTKKLRDNMRAASWGLRLVFPNTKQFPVHPIRVMRLVGVVARIGAVKFLHNFSRNMAI
jgi:hypothetical protein